MIAQTRDGKACDLVIPLLRGGRYWSRVVAQETQCLPRPQPGEFPQLATCILKFSGVRVADREAAIDGGCRSPSLLLGRSQPLNSFIASADTDQRRTQVIVHGEPRPLAGIALEPDRVSQMRYCLSRSPGLDQRKRKSNMIDYQVRASLQ